MPRTTIRTEDITADAVTAPKIATGAVPAFDDSGLQDDIALLAFKTQANGSLARYNLVDQSVDSFEDASGVDASASTNEVRNASNYYYGAIVTTPTISGNYDSTGTTGIYTWYKWTTVTSSGSYTTDTAQDYEYLVIAGGGGGGDQGGGGAGGYRNSTVGEASGGGASAEAVLAVAASTVSGITVGVGGTNSSGLGGNSVFSTITSLGGGRGGGNSEHPGTPGGSGGAGGRNSAAGGTGTANQGFGGGNAGPDGPNSAPNYVGGGGGGAGAVGQNNQGASGPGDGGVGLTSSIDGSATFRGGGGGGGKHTSGGSNSTGGNGGGGFGYVYANTPGTAGAANTGGGGGGGAGQYGVVSGVGGLGGSGIVIIRRQTTIEEEGAALTLVSNAQTAQAQPTKGDIVVTYTNGTGTTTLNTDLVASVSRDNGANYTTATLVLQGTTGGHNIATVHDLDISGQPAGTSMRWKMVTANQSNASKTTRIQAVSLGWS